MLGKEITLAIAGNKCDLEKSRVVSLEEAEAYASTVGAKHYSTSAKMNQGLEDLFLDLAKRMCSHSLSLSLSLLFAHSFFVPATGMLERSGVEPSGSSGPSGGGGGVVIGGEDDDAPPEPTSCQC
mgnify:CR=1 FL=1